MLFQKHSVLFDHRLFSKLELHRSKAKDRKKTTVENKFIHQKLNILSGKTAQFTDRCLFNCRSQKSAGILFAPASPVKHCIAVFNAER